jgi:hypothetical protein
MAAIVEPIVSGRDALPVRLCQENLHGLVSLWKMFDFSTVDFVASVAWIEKVVFQAKYALIGPRSDAVTGAPDLLTILHSHLCHMQLKHSVIQCERLLGSIQSGGLPISDYGVMLDNLHQRILDELQSRVFYGVPEEMVSKFFYFPNANIPASNRRLQQRPPQSVFGEQVMAAFFRNDDHDPTEAINCLIQGRATACVFHLMRMLETGLTPLCSMFAVSLAHTNLGPALEELESRIKAMHKDPTWKALPEVKDRQEKYGQAASHFDTLRLAWRNYTAHGRGKYTEGEAARIFDNVSGFLQKTAAMLVRYPPPVKPQPAP